MGRPGGVVVKCMCSVVVAWGSDSGSALPHHLSGHVVMESHTKWRKMGTDVSPGPVFLSKKRRIGTC